MTTAVRRRALASLLAVLAASTVAHGQPAAPPVMQLVHRTWTAREGAPAAVLALAQTPDGVLWLGSASGLYRFDGVRFDRFEPPAGQALPAHGINSMIALPDGTLWLGYVVGGASRVDRAGVRNYGEREGLPPGVVTSLALDSSGTLWAATSRAIARLDGDRWLRVGEEAGYPGGLTSELMVDRRGRLWAVASAGVYVLPRGERRFLRWAPPLAVGEAERGSGSVREAPDGTVWAASISGGLFPMTDAQGDAPRPDIVGFRDRDWPALYIDRGGNAWAVATGGRVVRVPLAAAHGRREPVAIDSAWVRPLSPATGMIGSYVWSVLEDREGTVWVGTDDGLNQLRVPKFNFISWPEPSGLILVAAGEGGEVWAGSVYHPLARVRDRRVTHGGVPAGITIAHRDHDGGVWLAGTSGVWWKPRGRPFERVEIPPETAGGTVLAMAHDRRGALWLSVERRGVFRRRGRTWSRFDAPEPYALAMAADSLGRTWLGYTENRVARVDGDSIRLFTSADGLGVGAALTMHVRGARVWVGGELGIASLEAERAGARFGTLPIAGGTRGVSGIVETTAGDLWLNGADGVTYLPAAEVARARRDPAIGARGERFGSHDGIEGTSPGSNGSPSAIEGTDGRIWFSTTRGLASIDPRNMPRNAVPPLAQLLWLEAGGRRYPAGAPVTLPARTTALTIGYAASSLAIPERVRFRYQLVGNDTSWQEAGARREAIYTNLAPGAYTFRVIAANDDGVWSERGAEFAVAIPPTFVQTRFFLVLCALAGSATVWGLARWRQRRAAEALRARFEATLAERTRIAQELHDTLLQGFTGMHLQLRAVLQIVRNRPDEAVERLDQLASTASSAVRDARHAVWDMRAPELEELELPDALRAAAYDAVGSAPIEVEVAVEGQERRLPHALEAAVLRVGREAVTNAVRHAGAHTLRLVIRYDADVIALRVQDDGRGITLVDAEDARHNGHWGIVGMRERASRIGGTLDIASAPGAGTQVAFRAPIRNA